MMEASCGWMALLAITVLMVVTAMDGSEESDPIVVEDPEPSARLDPTPPLRLEQATMQTGQQPSKRARTDYTMEDKLKIIDFHEKNPKVSQVKLGQMAQDIIGTTISRQTVSDWLKPEHVKKVKQHVLLNPDAQAKRDRKSRVHILNEVLALWERQASKRGVFLSDAILIEKAKTIGRDLDLPTDFNYSQQNWLAHWKKKVRLNVFLFFHIHFGLAHQPNNVSVFVNTCLYVCSIGSPGENDMERQQVLTWRRCILRAMSCLRFLRTFQTAGSTTWMRLRSFSSKCPPKVLPVSMFLVASSTKNALQLCFVVMLMAHTKSILLLLESMLDPDLSKILFRRSQRAV